MKVVYHIYEDNVLLFVSDDKELAQEIILALTEEYIYHAFLREADSCGVDLALWLFRNAPKYGWKRFWYKERKVI